MRVGGLVLGYGFLWSDLVCYAVGIGAGVLAERFRARRCSSRRRLPPRPRPRHASRLR
jgi:hypothetical protein